MTDETRSAADETRSAVDEARSAGEPDDVQPAVRLDGKGPERRRSDGGSDERRRRTDVYVGASHVAVKNPKCEFCIGREFRRSRLRAEDYLYLGLLQFPVRCMRCRRRQRVSLMVARRSQPAEARLFPSRKSASWENFTSGSTARFDFEADQENVVFVPDGVPKRANPMRPLEQRPQAEDEYGAADEAEVRHVELASDTMRMRANQMRPRETAHDGHAGGLDVPWTPETVPLRANPMRPPERRTHADDEDDVAF